MNWNLTAARSLPPALASATYDAANQIATWAGTAFTYDANGNLTNDGAKTYAWNSRNHLTALSGTASASFSYDGVGRRRAKTISGVTTLFLYDGLNTVQELSSGSPSANIVSGPGIDEWVTRTDAASARHFMTDALGSTVALSDATGTVQTQYTYEPFGESTLAGMSSANQFEFTGRENDGTGLLYYRARYLVPRVQRFASEDPIGLAGGANVFAYAGNTPALLIDPIGLKPSPFFGPLLGLGIPWPFRGPGPNGNPNAPRARGPGPGAPTTPGTGPGVPPAPETPNTPQPERPRCSPGQWGRRWAENVTMTTGPFVSPPGLTLATGSWTYAALRSIGPLQWAAQGFGGATMGAATFTAVETGIIVGTGAVVNWGLTSAAWGTGVSIGAAIEASYYCWTN